MAKKYLSLERLTEYDELIKGEITDGDASTLASAKSYTDTEVGELSAQVAYINLEDNEDVRNPDIVATSITIDSALSETSTNPVQNAIVTAEINEISNNMVTSWNDLEDKPFGEETVEVPVVLEWDGDRTDRYSYLDGMLDGTCQISEKVIGNYQDLIGKKVEYYMLGTLYDVVLEESMYTQKISSISNASGYRFTIPYSVNGTNNWKAYLEFVTEAEDESRKGIYFGFDENWDKTYVTSLELNETTTEEVVKPINKNYLPTIIDWYGNQLNLVEAVQLLFDNW